MAKESALYDEFPRMAALPEDPDYKLIPLYEGGRFSMWLIFWKSDAVLTLPEDRPARRKNILPFAS